MFRIRQTQLLIVLIGAVGAPSRAQEFTRPELVKITNQSGNTVVCELLQETERRVTLVRLATGKEYSVSKADLASIQRDVSDEQAIDLLGLPTFGAWRTNREIRAPSGSVAVLPLFRPEGRRSSADQQWVARLTNALLQHGVAVIEQSVTSRALDGTDSSVWLDDAAIRRIGRQVGASAVLTGTIHARRSRRQTTLRLLDVATEKTLFVITKVERENIAASLADPPQRRFELSEQALCVAFSPDSSAIATCGVDGTVKLWDASNGNHLSTLIGHRSRVLNVSFSKDGTRIAASYFDGTVRLWHIETRQVIMSITAHPTVARSVAIAPNGHVLASAGDDSLIKLWTIPDGKEPQLLEGHRKFVRSVAFSNDERLLASGSNDGTIKLWDPSSGRLHGTLRGHRGYVYCVAFSADGRRLASASSDGTARLWNPSDRSSIATINPSAGAIHCIGFSPDGQFLATGHANDTVKLWRAKTQQHLMTLDESEGPVEWLSFSANGQMLAAACADETVRVWNLATLVRASLESQTGP